MIGKSFVHDEITGQIGRGTIGNRSGPVIDDPVSAGKGLKLRAIFRAKHDTPMHPTQRLSRILHGASLGKMRVRLAPGG